MSEERSGFSEANSKTVQWWVYLGAGHNTYHLQPEVWKGVRLGYRPMHKKWTRHIAYMHACTKYNVAGHKLHTIVTRKLTAAFVFRLGV